MKTKILTLSVALLVSTQTLADCNFTPEQDHLIKLASSYGTSFNYRKTLPAIVMQESFVGQYVVRLNPKDGKLGSYGITHILLETAMWLEGNNNRWHGLDNIAEKLIKDDMYALRLAVEKLDTVHEGNWMKTWSAYNGGSTKYAEKIKSNIRTLEKCGYFSWS